MSVRNCDQAEEIAKRFLLERFDFSNITIDSIDFDGNCFVVSGFNEDESEIPSEKTVFTVTIKTDGNVVGWRVT